MPSVGLGAGRQLVQRTHGYAVAEFAIVLPAILFVAAIVFSLIGITATQIQLESSAAMAARIIGRGDPLPDSYRNSLPVGTQIFARPDGDVVARGGHQQVEGYVGCIDRGHDEQVRIFLQA